MTLDEKIDAILDELIRHAEDARTYSALNDPEFVVWSTLHDNLTDLKAEFENDAPHRGTRTKIKERIKNARRKQTR